MKIASLLLTAGVLLFISSCASSYLTEKEINPHALKEKLSREDRENYISKRKIVKLVKTDKGLTIDPRYNYARLPENSLYSHVYLRQSGESGEALSEKQWQQMKRILRQEWPKMKQVDSLRKNNDSTLVWEAGILTTDPELYTDTVIEKKEQTLFFFILRDAKSGKILSRAKFMGDEDTQNKIQGMREALRFATERDPLTKEKFKNHELFSEKWYWIPAESNYYFFYKESYYKPRQEKGYVPALNL